MNFLTVILKGLQNPKIQKIILIILALFVLIWLLGKVGGGVRSIVADVLPTVGDNVNQKISDSRKQTLNVLAQELYDNIYSFFSAGGSVADIVERVNVLPDNELKYITYYYNSQLGTENGLYYDIDWEVLPMTTEDDKLLARMKKMNLDGFKKF